MYSSPTTITDERITECEAQGVQARKEGRSRSPAYMDMIERKAFQRGWDSQEAKIAQLYAKDAK